MKRLSFGETLARARLRAATRGARLWLLGALLAAVPAQAELEWQQQRVRIEPPAGASDAEAVFEFVNRGNRPVRIVDVQSGCGCTVAALEQTLVEPGARGRVRATFHVGERRGKQSVDVTVATEEPEAKTYALTLEVTIQDFATLSPRLLSWSVGGEATSKLFQLSLSNGFQFVAVESATPEFAVEAVKEGGDRVQLKITPRDLWARRNGAIKVKVAQPGKPPVELAALVRVL